MEVILLKPVRRLGKIGELVSVKDGFGRNFLLPQGVAVRATAANKEMIEEKKHELEAKNAETKIYAEKLAAEISGLDITFIRQAAADGRLFGSVAGKEIAAALAEAGHQVTHSEVVLDKPIKNLGVSRVTLALHTDVTTEVIVNVSRSDSEAIDALRDFKEGKSQTSLEKAEAEFEAMIAESAKESEAEAEEDAA